MAITQSAKKAHRASIKRAVFNLRRMENVRILTKQLKKLVSEKKTAEVLAVLPNLYKALDKASKSHTIRKGTADRKKSRLTKLVTTIIKK